MSNKYVVHEKANEGRTVEYYTPEFIFKTLGTKFDLDPCQPIGGLAHVPSDKYYSKLDNGLLSPWFGFVWMNPPYGANVQKKWLQKFKEHKNGIALLASRTDTLWFHEYVAQADSIIFIKGRLPFIDGTGLNKVGNVAAFGSLLVGYGEKAVQVLKNANSLGFLYVKQPS